MCPFGNFRKKGIRTSTCVSYMMPKLHTCTCEHVQIQMWPFCHFGSRPRPELAYKRSCFAYELHSFCPLLAPFSGVPSSVARLCLPFPFVASRCLPLPFFVCSPLLASLIGFLFGFPSSAFHFYGVASRCLLLPAAALSFLASLASFPY